MRKRRSNVCLSLYCSGGFGTTGVTEVARVVSANFSRIWPCFSRIATYGSTSGKDRGADAGMSAGTSTRTGDEATGTGAGGIRTGTGLGGCRGGAVIALCWPTVYIDGISGRGGIVCCATAGTRTAATGGGSCWTGAFRDFEIVCISVDCTAAWSCPLAWDCQATRRELSSFPSGCPSDPRSTSSTAGLEELVWTVCDGIALPRGGITAVDAPAATFSVSASPGRI